MASSKSLPPSGVNAFDSKTRRLSSTPSLDEGHTSKLPSTISTELPLPHISPTPPPALSNISPTPPPALPHEDTQQKALQQADETWPSVHGSKLDSAVSTGTLHTTAMTPEDAQSSSSGTLEAGGTVDVSAPASVSTSDLLHPLLPHLGTPIDLVRIVLSNYHYG